MRPQTILLYHEAMVRLALRPRHSLPHPWAPMTDPEWVALCPEVTYRRGRPPLDPRRTWDAIFWVACSTRPWSALPPELGDAATACSALHIAARNGVLERLLLLVSRHPFAREDMAGLEWRVCRAFVRAARQLTPGQLDVARGLGLLSALPCAAEDLPPPPGDDSMPRPPDRLPRIPRLPRRILRGLPPLRHAMPDLAPMPPPPRPGQPRRDEHAKPRPVRKAVKR